MREREYRMMQRRFESMVQDELVNYPFFVQVIEEEEYPEGVETQEWLQ